MHGPKLEGGRWVTMQGQHVYIKDGKVIAGPAHLMGKQPPPEGAQGAHEKGGSHKVGGRITVTSGPFTLRTVSRFIAATRLVIAPNTTRPPVA